ncbi:CAMK family protein kinase [Tritrichomonas foetus]|uniref:CAMK family protein kinase n=1 Tax=Tritrichomonas foetus TaxID=1144522 RepID=A0A1J4L037_9EUKA|nr:CAMK family protein kinase [Tritrichomonas foetus]|eukprot:OHT15318.1 CAMK family protein kinase [Tritrichomonas foetus]
MISYKNQPYPKANFIKILQVGRGSTSKVFCAYNKQSEKYHAIKKYDLNSLNEDIMVRLRREVEILHMCNHPAIIHMFDYGIPQNDNPPWIELEYMPIDLLHLIKEKKLGDVDAYKILYGLASAMKYLHDREIIHRDVNPFNIMIDHQCLPHLSDFGTARKIEPEMESRPQTISYAAPEILNGVQYDEKVDVYSFGLTLYYIIEKKDPFKNLSQYEITKRKNQGKCPLINQNNCLFNIMKKCVEFNPSHRCDFNDIIQEISNCANKILNQDDLKEFQDYQNSCLNFDTDSVFVDKFSTFESIYYNAETYKKAICVLGMAYWNVLDDSATAKEILENSANEGNSHAARIVCDLYEKGLFNELASDVYEEFCGNYEFSDEEEDE